MAYFNDAQEVYDTIGKLFLDLVTDEELGPKFRQANTIVQYAHRDPDSPITVRLMEDEPSDVDFGETEMEPEVVMSMEADTAHLFWLGRVNVPGRARSRPDQGQRPGGQDPEAGPADRSRSIPATRRSSRPTAARTWSTSIERQG